MISAGPRIVITGCGLVTSIGPDAASSWAGLLAGRSGRRPTGRFDLARYGHRGLCALAAVPDPGLAAPFPLDDASRMLLTAAEEAFRDVPRAALESMPCWVGTTLGGMDSGTRFYRSFRAEGLTDENRALLKDYMPFVQCRHLARRFGLRHTPVIVTNACASGANAIGLAWQAIRTGRAVRAAAAGYDIVSEFVFGGFHALRLIDPDACRPFDPGRRGLMLGEAAGVVLLETLEEARRAGRRPIAEITGYAAGVESYHITKPHPEGLGALRVMEQCLARAGRVPGSVTCINAHGTGTSNNDLMEAKAIARLFAGHPGLAVTANKAAVGHTLGAAGLVEAIFSALSIRDGLLPPTVHTREVIPELTARLVRECEQADVRAVLSTSYGFGGTNAALLLEGVADA